MGPGPERPAPPPGYQPTTPAQRQEWNTFLDYLKSQGNIDINNPQVGLNFFNQYKQNNPNFSLTPEQIPYIEYEANQLRRGDSFGNLNADQLKQLRQGLGQKFIDQTNTYQSYYPQYTKAGVSYGTDFEKFLNGGGNAPVATPTPVNQPVQFDSVAQNKKYSSNPYLMEQGRYNWGAKLSNTFPQAGGNVREGVVNAAKFNNIDPALLYGSAMEEGMSGAVDEKYADRASEAYVNWSNKNADKAGDYPVDGFYNYGLDQFADQAAALEKKGYLPKGFSGRFTKFYAENEKGEKLNAPAFKTDADALIAKSAMMRQANDQLEAYTKKTGITLTPHQKEFFLLANYNGGVGNMQKMIQSYKDKGYLKDDKFLDVNFKPAAYGGIYKNVQARLQVANQLRNEKLL